LTTKLALWVTMMICRRPAASRKKGTRSIAGVGSRVDETAAQLALTRRVAVGGIVWESFGLVLVVFGLALQALGFVITAANATTPG
jgi:hypothetical protein